MDINAEYKPCLFISSDHGYDSYNLLILVF